MDTEQETEAPVTVGRNRYGLTIEVELTHPLSGTAAENAAQLLAADVSKWLRESDWGYGVARIESAYAPRAQFENGDFVPEKDQ